MLPSNTTSECGAPIIKQVAETIDQHTMFTPGDRVLVGVSGGPDSVALLYLLKELAPTHKFHLAVAHLNHGLRPQADPLETEYVAQLAKHMRLPFHLKDAQLDPNQGSLEERARDARYHFFHAMTETHGYTKIAVGHQADDNAEAVLMHLLRGSGPRGLYGMAPTRDNIVRPLINLRRHQILEFLKSRRIRYLLDESNTDLRFGRNRIRHQLMPLLQEHYNPNIVATLLRTAKICREEDQWLDQHLRPLAAQLQAASTSQSLTLDLDVLWHQPRAIQRRLIRSALRQWRGHLKGISAPHVEALIRLSHSNRSSGCLNLPGGLAAERCLNQLQFSYLEDPGHFPDIITAPFCHPITSVQALPAKIEIPEIEACMTFSIINSPARHDCQGLENNTAWFDLNRLDFPLYIRNMDAGDRFAPLGTAGTQKLKKLFINCKIPQAQRSRTPIIASAGTIYWVAGLRRSSDALISTTTRQALCVTYRGGAVPTTAACK